MSPQHEEATMEMAGEKMAKCSYASGPQHNETAAGRPAKPCKQTKVIWQRKAFCAIIM
jgi:hypothetical protein